MTVSDNASYPCVKNGNYQGFTNTVEDSPLIFLGIPWDVTTSYSPGTADGPAAIIEASYQLEYYSSLFSRLLEFPLATITPDTTQREKSRNLRTVAHEIILALERGGDFTDTKLAEKLAVINTATEELRKEIFTQTHKLLEVGKYIGLAGGDHSVPLGFIQALDAFHSEPFGILQIDAHADLRQAYEGFTHSHASIMHNVLASTNVSTLVQVGIRDLCSDEAKRIEEDSRIHTFYDNQIKRELFRGATWLSVTENIVSKLPKNIYISFDIDGLVPSLAPDTGTPVPGGLNFSEVSFLLEQVILSGRRVVGFDLVEVAPAQQTPESYEADWNAVVGARIYRLLADTLLATNFKS
jgi:agmatinase